MTIFEKIEYALFCGAPTILLACGSLLLSPTATFGRCTKKINFYISPLAIEIMQEPQSNLKEKNNPSILEYDFSSRTEPSIF